MRQFPVIIKAKQTNLFYLLINASQSKVTFAKQHSLGQLVAIDLPLTLTYSEVNHIIGKCHYYASILFSLYATHNLFIPDHPYPAYGTYLMRHAHTAEKLTIDHIKPRRLYPELTFDFNNWQLLTLAQNQAKEKASRQTT